MTFDEYWARLLERNPDMKGAAKVTISLESFKKSLRQAFEQGAAQSKGVGGVFNDIFGVGAAKR